MRRPLKFGVTVVTVAVVGWAVYWLTQSSDGGPAASAPARPPVVVEAARVRVDSLQPSVSAVGTLRSQESIVLRPELAGRIVRLGFEEGQPVERGQLLVALDDSIYSAELAQSEASLTLSRANHQRAEELVARGATSERTRDEALAKMRMDEASVALARARLAKTTLQAPHSGVTGLRQVGVGDYVSPGDELVTLEVIDPIKLAFRVPEIYLSSVAVDQAADFVLDALPGQKFAATIYAIDPQVDINGRSLAVLARAPNQDGLLKPGLFARVSLLLPAKADSLLVPEEAVVPNGTEHFLYRVINGAAVQTTIEIGMRLQGEVEITDGIGRDDVVVTSGHLKLRDGTTVTIRNELGG